MPEVNIVTFQSQVSQQPLPNWFLLVNQMFKNAGVPTEVWLSICWGESGGNAEALNNTVFPAGSSFEAAQSGEYSIGLFQLNKRGWRDNAGYHPSEWASYTDDQLKDPVLNAQLGATNIVKAYKIYGDDIVAVCSHSGHPGFDGVAYPGVIRISHLYNQIKDLPTANEKWSSLAGTKTIFPWPGDEMGDTKPTNAGATPVVGKALDATGQAVHDAVVNLGKEYGLKVAVISIALLLLIVTAFMGMKEVSKEVSL